MSASPDVLTPAEAPPPAAGAPRTRAVRVYTALRHAAADPSLRLGVFSLLGLITLWPVLGTANQLSLYQDSQQHSLFEEVARQSVARFHELPLWDPYYCGGLYGLGTPSARYVSPPFVLTLLFGTLRGAALTSLVMTVIGLEGAFRYMRARGGGALGAMVMAPAFALSGVFAHATLVSWTNFFGFELVPWALLGVRLALTGSRRGVVLAALTMGFMVGFGGTYTAPLTAIAIAFEVVTFVFANLVQRPGARGARLARYAAMGALVVLLSAATCMVRLWPIAENLTSSPRLLGGKPGSGIVQIAKHLFGDPGNKFAKGEFLVGLPILPLMLFGVWRKRAIASVLGTALWVWFAVGYKMPFSIFAALRTIPPYTMLRAPERFLVFAALAGATVAALGIRRVEVAMRKRPRAGVVGLVLLALAGVDVYLVSHLGIMRAGGRKLEAAPPLVTRDFRQDRGNRWIAAYYPWMSTGSLTCFDDYDVVQAPGLRGDLPAEEYLRDTDAGTVKRLAWSPDRIDLAVDLSRPARVFVNQNWHPGWRSSVGTVVPDDELLAVDVPEGAHTVTLRFQPRSAFGGGATTLLALVGAGFLAYRARRRDEVADWTEWLETLPWCVAPFAAVALSLWLVHEPTRPPPPLLTPAGEAIVVDRPPADATHLGTTWEGGIVLDASHLDVEPGDDSHGPTLTVELDWRFEQPLPPGLGIYMQFEAEGQRFATDHVLISGAVVPEAAPLHTVLRDVSEPIALPEAKKATVWKAWAGVWRARRDMSRLDITDVAGTTTLASRVLVGTFVVPAQAQAGGAQPRGDAP